MTEAGKLAEALLTSVDADALTEEVADAVSGVDFAELNGRAGRQPWGYVEPTEAAWEVLGEAISPFIDDLNRLLALGAETAAVGTCTGIVLGLYTLHDTNSDGVLAWAPDFPLETATDAISVLVDGAGSRSRVRVAALRLADEVPDWADAIARVARRGPRGKR